MNYIRINIISRIILYSNWPENIKQRFNKCLDSTSTNENNTMSKFREILSNLTSLFKLYNLYSAYNEYQEIKDFTHKITDKMDYFDKELEN